MDKKLQVSVEEDETLDYGINIKLSANEQKEIISDIKDHVQKVIVQRNKIGIESEWNDADDIYNGKLDFKDFPYEDCHNIHIHITSMTVDILNEKTKKRTLQRPILLARALPGATKYDPLSVQKKEKWLDYRVFADNDFEESLDPIYLNAINLGTGIAKTCHIKDIETVREVEVYEGMKDTPEFITAFMGDENKSEYKSNLKKLAADETIEIWVEKEHVRKYAPVVKSVEPVNLYIDCHIEGLENHRIIAEKIEDVSWKELENYFNTKYFNAELKKEIMDKYKAQDEYRKMTYTLWESNYLYKAKSKTFRSIITYIEGFENTVARAISFPYITRKPNYEIYKIKGRKDCIYGTGIAKLLRDSNILLNELWNQSLDSGELNNAPMFKAKKGTAFDPTEKQYGPAVIWWLENMADVEQFKHSAQGGEIYQLLEYAQRYAEWITGVSAYMSGRESPIDPNAPASKAYMLLQESNLRINAYIRKIDASNVRLYEQLEKMYYQYFREDQRYFVKENGTEYLSEGITRKELAIPVEWVPQLSDVTINKALEREENLKMAQWLMMNPMIQQNPAALRKILEIVIRSGQGEWDKQLNILLPSEEETNGVMHLKEALKTMAPTDIMGLVSQMMGGQQPGAPEAPQPGEMTSAGNQAVSAMPVASDMSARVPEEVIPQ